VKIGTRTNETDPWTVVEITDLQYQTAYNDSVRTGDPLAKFVGRLLEAQIPFDTSLWREVRCFSAPNIAEQLNAYYGLPREESDDLPDDPVDD